MPGSPLRLLLRGRSLYQFLKKLNVDGAPQLPAADPLDSSFGASRMRAIRPPLAPSVSVSTSVDDRSEWFQHALGRVDGFH